MLLIDLKFILVLPFVYYFSSTEKSPLPLYLNGVLDYYSYDGSFIVYKFCDVVCYGVPTS